MAVDSVPNPTAGSAGLFSWQPVTLTLKTPFRLSYGVTEQRTAWWLRLRDDLGWGEGTIPPYYGISTEAMEAYWQRNSQRTEPLPERIGRREGIEFRLLSGEEVELDDPVPVGAVGKF